MAEAQIMTKEYFLAKKIVKIQKMLVKVGCRVSFLIIGTPCALTNFPVLSIHCPSTLPVTLNAQQEPHWPGIEVNGWQQGCQLACMFYNFKQFFLGGGGG